MNLRFHIFVCGVHKGNGEGGESKSFLFYPRGLRAFPRARWSNLVPVAYLEMIEPMGVGFCSI